MVQRMVVALDGSALAEHALPHARAVARAFGSEIVLVRVMGSAPRRDGMVDSLHWRLGEADAKVYLDRTVESLQNEGFNARGILVAGRAAEQILQTVQRESADLIVITTHGEGGLSPHPISGTAYKVVCGAPGSVLLVRVSATPVRCYDRILVPVDCSKRSEWALRLATAVARANQAELVAANVLVLPALLEGATLPGDHADACQELLRANRRAAETFFADLPTKLSATDLKVRTRIIEGTHAGYALTQLLEDEQPGLVIMSAHGALTTQEWTFGSVVRDLLISAPTSLLIFQDAPRAAGRPELVGAGAAATPVA